MPFQAEAKQQLKVKRRIKCLVFTLLICRYLEFNSLNENFFVGANNLKLDPRKDVLMQNLQVASIRQIY